MSMFHTLVIISFLCIVFLLFISNFLYKKWLSCFEEIKKINYFNKKTFKAIQDIKEKVSECGIITENTQDNYDKTPLHYAMHAWKTKNSKSFN